MPHAILLSAVCCWLVALILSAPAEARRVALVIGNSDYKVGPLANPANDAAAVAMTLETQLKFDKVILRQNLGSTDFRDALSQFSSEAMGADIALIYFAGHGIEASGVNFLLPVDAMLRRASDLNLQAIALPTVLEQLDGVRTLKLVILDACRDNPFPLPGAKRTVKRGLTRIEPDGNTLVFYAAKDGTTADDGVGRKHSPFTEALLKHLATPKLEVRFLVARVRDEVIAATGSAQVPHHYGTLGGKEVYLRKDALAAPVAEKLPAPEKQAGLPPPPPLGVQKDKAPSPPAPVMLKDKAPSPPTERPFERIVGDVRLAVVSIDADGAAADVTSDELKDYFNKRYGVEGTPKRPTLKPVSGLIVSADGYVVTASAAVAGARGVKVRVDGKGTQAADIVGVDNRTGVALLKIRQTGTWSFVPLGSNAAQVGDSIFAIGSAFGLSGTALKGHVTGLDRDIGVSPFDFVQTDIVFPKDDFLGSPLFDMRGSVVGIVTAKGMAEKAQIVFAFPTRDVLGVVEQLKAKGQIKRGWLGVRIQNVVNEDMAASLGLKEAKGALVAEVQSPSPASTAGIKRGDTILSVNGVIVADSRHLSRQVAGFPPNTTIKLKVMRAWKEQSVQVRLGLLPSVQELSQLTPAPTQPSALSQLGLSVGPVQGSSRVGVQITGIEPDSTVAQKVRVGDIILEADNRSLYSAEDLIAAVLEANRQNRRAVLLLIKSGNETRFEPARLRRN